MTLDICICTHNPRRETFDLVLTALGRQTLPKDLFQVFIIDNASTPPLDKGRLAPLIQAGVSCFLVREEQLGNVHARRRAIQETRAEWIVFVDDDNELAENYLATVAEIIAANPTLGCFGGKLLLANPSLAPAWVKPLLPQLAVIDHGEKAITKRSNESGPWEPPTAGAAVKRPLLDAFLHRLAACPESAQLGRKGNSSLLSSEDSLLMRGAFELGFDSSYQPRLVLRHHLHAGRFQFRYVLRLFHGYGRSEIILDRCLGVSVRRSNWLDFLKLMLRIPFTRKQACLLARKWGRVIERHKPA